MGVPSDYVRGANCDVIKKCDKDKADLMAKSFAKVHSVDQLTVEGRRRREVTLSNYPDVLVRRLDSREKIDDGFTMAELVRAIKKAKPSAPGGDQVSYVMLKHLGGKFFRTI